MQQWIDGKHVEGIDVFEMLDFDFMPMETELVGDKIKDTLTNQPQQEDWNKMPPMSQGLKIVLAWTSQLQVTFCVNKGSVTPSTLGIEIEQVQTKHEEEPQQVSTDEV